MRKYLVNILIFIITLGILQCTYAEIDNEGLNGLNLLNITFTNKIIENAIRDELKKPQGILTMSDILSIKSLRLSNKGLSNLNGIEYLTNIEELYLDNNNLEEIDSLRELTKLRILHLQRNNISDINPLTALTSLEELSLNGNKVSSLQPLSSMVNLQRLYVTENNITDISPLNNLINLKTLYIRYGNYIRDYSPISSYYENIINSDLNFTEDEYQSMLSGKNKPLLSIQQLIEEAKQRKTKSLKLKLNGYYAISSYDQYEELKNNRNLTAFDSISFAWAFVDYDNISNTSFINLDSSINEFRIPDGYNEPISYVKRKRINRNINIYASDNYDTLFSDSNKLIKEITALLRGKNKQYKGLSFNGVVIDFENLPLGHKENYVKFLSRLDKKLKRYNKTLIVAVSPSNSYDYARIVEIADNVILMLHDYDVKNSNNLSVVNGRVDNPNTPIRKIEGDLITILNQINRDKYISKLWLQINFSINQIKVNNGVIINQIPYKPTYNDLVTRIESELENGKVLDSIMRYNHLYENPYIMYTNENITNFIWYEDDRSISAKIKLAKDLGLGGISLWRIGSIPDYSSDIYLDTWTSIKELLNK